MTIEQRPISADFAPYPPTYPLVEFDLNDPGRAYTNQDCQLVFPVAEALQKLYRPDKIKFSSPVHKESYLKTLFEEVEPLDPPLAHLLQTLFRVKPEKTNEDLFGAQYEGPEQLGCPFQAALTDAIANHCGEKFALTSEDLENTAHQVTNWFCKIAESRNSRLWIPSLNHAYAKAPILLAQALITRRWIKIKERS